MIYLIDCENVGESGLVGIDQLPKADEAVLFFGKMQTSLSMETHNMLMRAKCKITSIQMSQTGRNYLDMQLAAHMGYMMKEKPKAEFTIVSKDKGFDSIVDYALVRNRAAQRVEALVESTW